MSLRVLTKANAGAVAARNFAFSLAQGTFVQWMDADDMLAPDKIAQRIKAAQQTGSALNLYTGTFGEFFADTSRAKFKPTVMGQDLISVDFLL